MAQPDDAPAIRPQGLLDQSAAAWIVLGALLLFTLTMWRFFDAQREDRSHDRFLHQADNARSALKSRMQAYEQVLNGTAGLFAASAEVSRGEFRRYVESLELDDALPGIQGTGFALMVPGTERLAHEAAVRAEGFPDYRIHPEEARDTYSTILYLEPFEGRNLRAFGYDMYSEPIRREAMNRARDTGRAALSGKVVLVQETEEDVQAGFLIYLPIYRGDAVDDVLSRRALLVGFVYSPFRAHDLMQGVFGDASGTARRDVEIEVYDLEADARNLLFTSRTPDHMPRFTTDRTVEFGGRVWVVRFSSSAQFERDMHRIEPYLVLLAGIVVDILIFAVIYGSVRHRRKMRRAALRLADSRDEFRTLVENVPGVVFRCAPRPPWRILHINKGILDLTGEPPEHFIEGEHPLAEIIHPDDRPRIEETMMSSILAQAPYEAEFRVRSRFGQVHWVSARGQALFDRNGSARWVDGVMLDITERRAAEAAIRQLAFIDPLTQLPNRRFLLDRLRQGLANSDRTRRCGALLFIDLDHFKDVNDTHGHEAGDSVLTEISQRLKHSVREGDTVARLGGDEFIIMLENLGDTAEDATEKAEAIASKVLADLGAPLTVGGHAVTTTPSIGISIFCGQDPGADELLKRADRAMYRAKAAGRNRIAHHTAL